MAGSGKARMRGGEAMDLDRLIILIVGWIVLVLVPLLIMWRRRKP